MTSLLGLLPISIRHRASVGAHFVKYRIETSRLIAGRPIFQMKVPRVVAVHFPKAGGSSLLQQFAAVLRSQMAMDYAADPLAGPSAQRAFPAGKSIVIGHFRPDRYADADAFRMTFLRHPVMNLISMYYFWKTIPDRGHPMHHRFLQNPPTLLDFARDPRLRYLMSETFFGGYDMERFDFIGFNETRSADLDTLSGLLGIPLSGRVHLNRTPPSDEYLAAQNDKALHAALLDVLADDVAFYDRLRNQRARR